MEVAFLDVEMAIKIVNQPVHLSLDGPKCADRSSNSFCPSKEVFEFFSFIILKL